MHRFCVTALILGMVISMCFAGEDEDDTIVQLSMDDMKNMFEDAFDGPKGFFFTKSAEEVEGRVQSMVETMKEFAEEAKGKSKSGLHAAKGFSEGIGDHVVKVKESIQESGEMIRDAFTSAAEKSKDEFETAASKISEHAKKASDTVFNLFKFD